jgi:hypothetical protein
MPSPDEVIPPEFFHFHPLQTLRLSGYSPKFNSNFTAACHSLQGSKLCCKQYLLPQFGFARLIKRVKGAGSPIPAN